MANKTTIVRAPNGDPVPMVLVDNGDGTYSLGTSALSSTPGTAAASLGKAEDAAHASGDVGVMLLAVRKDTAAALAASYSRRCRTMRTASGSAAWRRAGTGYGSSTTGAI